MKLFARLAVFGLLAFLGALTLQSTGLAAQQPIGPGGIYQSGTALHSPYAGIGFTVPAGFAGQWDGDTGGVVLQSQNQQSPVIGAVWGWSAGTVEAVAEEIGNRLNQLGVQVSPRGEPQMTEESLRGVFNVISQQGAGLLSAAIQMGPDGNVFAAAALGSTEMGEQLDAFVDAVASSAQFSVPEAASWRGQVDGSVLQWTGGGSDMSSGVVTATGASGSQASISFCYGQYRYQESSETYVSIPGASASSTSSDEHAGEWYLVANLAGGAMLYLYATDGRTFAWTVEEGQNGWLIDGYLYQLAGGC